VSDRPPEPEEAGEPDEPTEVAEPEEPTEVSEPEEPTEVSEPEEPTEVTEPGEPEPPDEPATEETVADEPTTEETTQVAPAAREEPRLTRSRDDRVIAGVCAGLARYLGIDPVLVRIAALLLIFAGGLGIVLYVIGWITMPEERLVTDGLTEHEHVEPEDELERRRGAAIFGLVFIVLGIFFLLDEVWPDLSWQYVWPAALIAVGFAIIVRGRR